MNFLSVLYAKAGITVDGVTELNNTATALTPATNDSSTKIATTAFVKNQNYYPYPTGTTAQYVRGDGSLDTFPTTIQQAQRLITEVYNETGATLTKGTVVYINGGHGNLPTVTKALANSDATSAQTYGVVQSDITDNNNGFVVVVGSIIDLDTFAYANGTILYLSPTTAGAWTSTKPYAPQHIVYVGIVTRQHPTQGIVEIKIQNGYEMDELHNVSAQNPSNGDILQYVTSTGLWTKIGGTTSAISEGSNLYFTNARSRSAISLTTTGTSGAATYNSTTGVLNVPNYADTDTGITSLNGLTALTQTFAVGTSGTDFGISSATSTHTFNLPTASATNRGALSSADWTTFNNKQNALTNPITGTGTTNYLPKFTGASALGNSIISESGSAISIAGNLGVSATISSWISQYKAIDIGLGGFLYSRSDNDETSVGTNWYRDGSAAFLYKNNGFASMYTQGSGQHTWYNAPSGTAGNAVTFTQAMTLDASGQLGIGTSSPAYKLDVNGTARVSGALTAAAGLFNIGSASDTWAANSSEGLAIKGSAFSGAIQTITSYLDNTSIRIGAGVSQKTGILINGQTTGAGSSVLVSTGGATRLTINSTGNATFTEDATINGVKVGRGAGNIATNTAVGSGTLNANTTGATNTAVGVNALTVNTTGSQNTSVGVSSLSANNGSQNTAIGRAALFTNTTGINNTGLGYQALYFNSVGSNITALGAAALLNNTASNNTAVGFEAATTNTSGTGITAIGHQALKANTTGAGNTAVGGSHSGFYNGALSQNTTGSNNVAVGTSLTSNITGSSNVSVGWGSSVNNTAGSNNTALGYGALQSNTTSNNTAVGFEAGFTNASGTGLTAIGFRALKLSTGNNNTALGSSALLANTTAADNTAVGVSALGTNTTGVSNTGIGLNALALNSVGSNNTAVGRGSLQNNTASNNTALGFEAAYTNTSGTLITAIGYQALKFSTGANNTALGYNAGINNLTGTDNTFISVNSGRNNLTGASNVAIGLNSFYLNQSGTNNTVLGNTALYSNVSGGSNTAIGVTALYNNTASNNTALGFQAGNANTSGANNIFIGYQSTGVSITESNRTWIGNSSTTSTWLAGNVLIGTTTDAGYKLDVNGTARVSGNLTVGSNIILPDSQDISWGTGGYGAYKPTISATDGVGIKFYPDGQGSGNTFTINTNGTATFSSSVSIGTSSGSYRLNVLAPFTSGLGGAYIEAGEYDKSVLVLNHTNGSVSANLLDVQKSGSSVFKIASTGAATFSSSVQAVNGIFKNSYYNTIAEVSGSPYYGSALFLSGDAGINQKTWRIVTKYASPDIALVFESSTTSVSYGSNPTGLTYAETMRITPTGNVLIGTTTDSGYKLSVNGTALVSGSVTATNFIGAGTGLTGTASALSIGGNAATATTAGALTSMLISQFTNDSGYVTSGALGDYLPLVGGALTGNLTTNSSISIGTASPVTALDVEGGAYSNTTAKFGAAKPIYLINYDPHIGFNTYYDSGWKYGTGSSSSFAGTLGCATSTGDFTLQTSTAGGNAGNAVTLVALMTWKQSGFVGIGTIAPEFKLDVAGGNARINGVMVGKGANSISTNLAVGVQALYSNTTGYENTAIGYYAMYSNTTAIRNTALGNNALYSNTTGASNVAIGAGSLYSNIDGRYNSSVGYNSMQFMRGEYNSALGRDSMRGSLTAANNTGQYNTAVGYESMLVFTSGQRNTSLGYGTGGSLTTGSRNTFVGAGATQSAGGIVTTGNNNTIIGGYGGTTTLSDTVVLADGSGQVQLWATGKNVALGTTSPTTYANYTTLHIAGQTTTNGGVLRLTTSDSSIAVNIFTNNAGANYDTTTSHSHLFNINGASSLIVSSSGIDTSGSITTADPGSGAAAWLLGDVQNATVSLITNQYVEVVIGGSSYQLALVQLE